MQQSKKPTKLLIGVLLIGVGIALLVWALTGNSAEAPSTNNTSKTEPISEEAGLDTTVATAETAEITFTNSGFSPQDVSVKKGTKITVKNDSDSNVQFSSDDHPTHTKQTEMNLRTLQPGESASFTVTRVGTWGFHDHIDDSKTGTLTVTE